MTDEQWALIEPQWPAVRTGGRPEKHPRRAVVDAILYVVRAGAACGFSALADRVLVFRPVGAGKVIEKILPVVREHLRLQEGRDSEPSAGLIDSRSVKAADTVGGESRGYGAGKKINGCKRFIVTATLGLLLAVVICTASMQDRDGAKPVLLDTHLATPVRFVFADGAFAERLLGWAQTMLRTTLHIVRKPSGQHRFAVIPRRWAVERTLAWLTAHRRLARDYERDPAVSQA
jgi:transposase